MHFSLRRTLILVFFGGLSVLLAINGWFEYRWSVAEAVAARRDEIAARLEGIARHAELWNSRQADLDEEIAYHATDAALRALVLVDAEGRVLAASRSEWRGREAAGTVPGFVGAELAALLAQPLPYQRVEPDGRRLVAWQPYELAPAHGELRPRTGALFLAFDLGATQDAIRAGVVRRELVSSGMAATLVLLLYLWLMRYLVRPLTRLRDTLAGFDPSRDAAVETVGVEEVAAIAQAFNSMSRDLSATWQAIPDLLFELDADCRYLRVGDNRPEWLMASADAIVGRRVTEVLPSTAAAVVLAAIDEARATGRAWGREVELTVAAGNRWFELAVARKDMGEGRPPHFIMLARDVSSRKQAEGRQRLAERVMDASSEGVTITDARGRILAVNRAFTAITGYTMEEAIGHTPKLLGSGRHDSDFYRAMWAVIKRDGRWEGEIWNRRKDGKLLPEWLSINAIRDENEAVTHYVGIFSDLSKLKESEARVEELAWRNPLTGHANRAFLLARLEEAVTSVGAGGPGFALLLINLRGFQRVNSSYGFATGDAVLREAVRRIEALTEGHLVSHLEGDEFAVFVSKDASQSRAARLGERLLDELSCPYVLDAGAVEVHLGAAIGIALCPDNGKTVSELMQQADAALKEARREEGSASRFANAELTESARRRLDLEVRLRRAVTEGQLRVYYQPQVDVRRDRVIGAEALVRWEDPQRGLVPPGQFIPLAEESGLIVDIGRWVLETACRDGAARIAAGRTPLPLAVNVAARQLMAGDFVATVEAALAHSGFPAALLELELTESTLMGGGEALLSRFAQLRELGVSLSIDDFGTGYSSLAYLQRFPVSKLKIDKCFVDELSERPEDRRIVAAIVSLGHALKLDVLAEGVERADQLEWLERLGCDSWQGYLKGAPMPAAEFAARF